MKKFFTVVVLVLLVALGLFTSLRVSGDNSSGSCKKRSESRTVVAVLPNPDQLLYTDKLTLSHNGKVLGAVCLSGICLFNTSDGSVNTIRNSYGGAIALSPDSSQLVVGNAEGCLRLVEADSGQVVREWGGHWNAKSLEPMVPSGVFDLAFSPRGDLLASVGDDGMLRIWSVDKGHQVLSVPAGKDNQQRLAFSADGRFLAALTNGNPVTVVDLDQQTVTKTGSVGHVGGVSYGGQGRLAVTQDNQLLVFDSSGGVLLSTEVGDHSGGVAMSEDGTLVALSDKSQNSVSLWDVDSGKRIELTGLAGAPDAVQFSPDGKKLYVAALAEGIVVFDVASEKREATWKPCGDKKGEGGFPPRC